MTKEAPKSAASAPEAKATGKQNRGWKITIAAVSVALIALIGGTVYYANVEMPKAQNEAAASASSSPAVATGPINASDLKACEFFAIGFTQARMSFLAEAQQKDHKPDMATAVEGYMTPMVKMYADASKVAAKGGEIASAIDEVGTAVTAFQKTYTKETAEFPGDVDTAAQKVDALCTPLVQASEANSVKQ